MSPAAVLGVLSNVRSARRISPAHAVRQGGHPIRVPPCTNPRALMAGPRRLLKRFHAYLRQVSYGINAPTRSVVSPRTD